MGRHVYHIDWVLIIGLQDHLILDVQVGADLAMSGPVVSQEVPGFDEQRLNPRKFLFEGVDIADTPCQPPDPGRLSATGLKTAVDVAGEM